MRIPKMYDTIRSGYEYPLPRNLRTEDLLGVMACLWLDPAGQLWEIDYANTHSFVDAKCADMIPNGNHGKVRPYHVTKEVSAYCGQSANRTLFRLHFQEGVLQYYQAEQRTAQSEKTNDNSTIDSRSSKPN
jgi:hypothetical protein